jgi:hypothetical protein
MRIVHVEDFIHPDAGYQVNTLSRLQVKQGHEVIIVTSELDKVPDFLTEFFGKDNIQERDTKFFETTGAKIIRVPIMGFYSGRAIHYPKLFRTVDSLKPDVAFIHGEDTLMGMLFIMRSSRIGYPLVLDCHSVEMSSINRFRKLFRIFFKTVITPRIINNQIPLIRVVDVDYVQKFFGIPLEHTALLSFGTDTDYFKPNVDIRHNFRKELGIGDDVFLAIYAGKLDNHKGGLFLARSIAEKLTTQSGRKINFLIIGNTIGDYGKSVEEIFSKSQNKIFRFPTQSFFDLAKFYQTSDLAVFPRQCSLSFFEVQSSGLPVLFEDNEVNIQRAQFGNGLLFNPADINDFRSKLIRCADMRNEDYSAIRTNARKYILDNYDYVPVSHKFNEVLEKEALRFKRERLR